MTDTWTHDCTPRFQHDGYHAGDKEIAGCKCHWDGSKLIIKHGAKTVGTVDIINDNIWYLKQAINQKEVQVGDYFKIVDAPELEVGGAKSDMAHWMLRGIRGLEPTQISGIIKAYDTKNTHHKIEEKKMDIESGHEVKIETGQSVAMVHEFKSSGPSAKEQKEYTLIVSDEDKNIGIQLQIKWEQVCGKNKLKGEADWLKLTTDTEGPLYSASRKVCYGWKVEYEKTKIKETDLQKLICNNAAFKYEDHAEQCYKYLDAMGVISKDSSQNVPGYYGFYENGNHRQWYGDVGNDSYLLGVGSGFMIMALILIILAVCCLFMVLVYICGVISGVYGLSMVKSGKKDVYQYHKQEEE
eukprot:331031_1